MNLWRDFWSDSFIKKQAIYLCIVAFLLRAITFYMLIQPHRYYHQADSVDYHHCTLGLGVKKGMWRLDKEQPIFWRTPGYPLYLLPFYTYYGITHGGFKQNAPAQELSIWFQIILCSFVPLLVLFLGYILTQSVYISLIAGWISVFHLGIMLGSCYLLSDAIALLFFLLFLLFFYKQLCLMYEPNCRTESVWYIVAAAISLALFTWIRPMATFIALFCAVLLFFSKEKFLEKLKRAGLFLLLFFALLSPWYIRNYNLTGHFFFCPISGAYVEAFCAPKILRTISGKPLVFCMNYLLQFVKKAIAQEMQKAQQEGRYVSFELVCGKVAWPIIYQYPGLFAWDWMKEVCKTTFDLNASQIVNMVRNQHTYDPPEEFLSEKLADCLYRQPMHFSLRLIAWLEFLFALLKWIGIICGLFFFFLQPAIQRSFGSLYVKKMCFVWLKVGFLIGLLLCMTGGFGYARLRMPADPLLIILSLTAWYWICYKKNEKDKGSRYAH